MAVRQYIGARYVPVFFENSDGTSDWRANVIYEPLTIVTWNNNTYTSKRSVPANIGNPSENPYYWAAMSNFNQQIQELTEQVNAMQEDVNEANEGIELLHSDIITIKSYDETIDGFPYAGFCGGCNFAGMELYAFRAAPEHKTVRGDYGEIVFMQRKAGNVFERVNIVPTYDSITYGELRDPNLSVSRDGERLYVSCFASVDDYDEDESYTSLVFCFDRTLTQLGVNIIPNTLFWGNTIETPSGFLIHGDYTDFGLNLYRTTQAITSANFGSASWVRHQVFNVNSGVTYAEPTLGYFNNRLVMITRTAGNSEIAWTADAEGLTGWTKNFSLFKRLHAPALIPYYNGEYLPFTGSIIDATITGSSSKRLPYFSLLSFEDRSLSSNSYIAEIAGGLVVPVNAFGQHGGYTTIVKIDETTFGVMYYDDASNGNAVSFTKINLNNSLVNYTYLSMVKPNSEVIITGLAINAYNGKLRNLIVDLLSHKATEYIIFTSEISQSMVTDKPSGLTSDFYGIGKRVNDYYYIELHYFSGNVPKMAAVVGTSTTVLSADWTIVY